MESSIIQKLSEEVKLFPYEGFYPTIGKNVFLASGVKLIGNVEIGNNSSIWYNTIIRGDVHYIKIGEDTNIQDCSMLHVTNGKYPLNIGNRVTIGHSVALHGCKLNDLCLIGIGAIVLDGAIIESNSMVAAGALVKQNFIVPSGKLVAGVPAKIIRNLTREEILDFEESAKRYVKYSRITEGSMKDKFNK
ncbi:MAG: gamma carbonic anhydrase family protein [Ignavibacteriaceae bacterium]|jgi:carbonic anhydrase/acetyltransferase-like protein (isoleucine patch superfamily)|nr:gamma carbonic anhydrase family protein [Ignavibacteriaceae bacterium]MCW8813596.1 gamma carbonic anhydrase family protein [Chlorobium sp.]MCW8818351.1 gamma carbonic anhydrase family protein [Ignavibacteriaceae bacterium]MCW8823747.1 gamma carbonic anhydrase family protein [Ignavibacteriaceae bacterium]MCW8960449.1 gamma carbonic anhydrase family protein [Ignavibacteriaceae bacterium]